MNREEVNLSTGFPKFYGELCNWSVEKKLQTSVNFMFGLILDTAAAVGDIVISCSSVSTDLLPAPGQKEKIRSH